MEHLAEAGMMYVCLLFALSVHEASHAAIANWCGDPSARLLGRLTLNPIKHADPIGTVVMPMLMLFSNIGFLFGWAKPVPFNPRNLHNMRRDPALIAIAGPASNLLLALLFAIILRLAVLVAGVDVVTASPAFIMGVFMIKINLVLMLFNCIPLPPLDGHHVLGYFLPPSGQQMLERIGPFGIIIAIMIGGRLIGPPLQFLFTVLLSYSLGVSLFQ